MSCPEVPVNFANHQYIQHCAAHSSGKNSVNNRKVS
jgi:hypothetical protein